MRSTVYLKVIKLFAVEVEDEESYGRRKIALLPLRIDLGNQVRQGDLSPARDSFSAPQNASSRLTLVLCPARDDRPLYDR